MAKSAKMKWNEMASKKEEISWYENVAVRKMQMKYEKKAESNI